LGIHAEIRSASCLHFHLVFTPNSGQAGPYSTRGQRCSACLRSVDKESRAAVADPGATASRPVCSVPRAPTRLAARAPQRANHLIEGIGRLKESRQHRARMHKEGRDRMCPVRLVTPRHSTARARALKLAGKGAAPACGRWILKTSGIRRWVPLRVRAFYRLPAPGTHGQRGASRRP